MDPLLRAHTALALLAIDPALGGLVVRARAGAVRDAVMTAVPAHTRLHPAMGAEALEGGIDVSATLSAGILTQTKGLLSQSGPFVLAMAERAEPYLAARLSAMLDRQAGQILITLDEGIDDETVAPALSDRLAFYVDLDGCALSDITPAPKWPDAIALPAVTAPAATIEALTTLAAHLGILSLRAVGAALRAAAAHAALNDRTEPVEADLEVAVALVFAHRATRLPAPPEEPPQEAQDDSPPPQDDAENSPPPPPEESLPKDILLDAVLAALPPDLLAKLNAGTASRSATGSGAGQKKVGNRRGRPLPARDGGTAQGRVDLIATLRAAIPWQTLRRASTPERVGPIIRHSDLRRKRYVDMSDRLLIFTVDASGSAAMARMGEAKGAIELLLAEAYARRDHVALIAFRGESADVLLEPTRSLVQTKRKLADLPGGGATPFAAGLIAARHMALQARRKGLTPTVIALTDGRGNITLDGRADRIVAQQDAVAAAGALRTDGIEAIVIDTGRRPEPALAQVAATLDATYIALPRADARSVSGAVTSALAD